MSESPHIQVPLDFMQSLVKLAEQAKSTEVSQALLGIPGVVRYAPTVDVTIPIRMLALELGRLVSLRNIFLRGDDIGTVDEKTGKWEAMGAKRFCGWVEEFCAFTSSARSQRLRDSLTLQDAELVLAQDIFRDSLRPLDAVHTMRLPVKRGDGRTEFLVPGYDAESRIFTVDVVKYEMDWTLERGLALFVDVFSEIPWNVADEATPDLMKNRSFAVHVTATMGTYCRGLFQVAALRPMIAYFANKAGTGKTRLAEAALAHVWGMIPSTGAPKDDEKMEVKLETIAQSRQPYVVFDDIGGGQLRSNHLNRFISATHHAGRKFHSNSEFFEAPNVTQVFLTANDLPTSEDLGRRALQAELFLAEEVRGRTFKRVITPQWLALPETRAQFLAACCAMLRSWLAKSEECGGPLLHPKPLETFEEWTAVIGGIVLYAGLADPLAQPEKIVGGAGQEDEMKMLLIAVASGRLGDCVITRKELIEEARVQGLISELVGDKDDPDLDDKKKITLGRRLQRWRAQKLRDTKGRMFQFGHKRKKAGATYPLTFLSKATPS